MAPLTLPPICLCLHPSSPSFKRDPSFVPSILLSALRMEMCASLYKALLYKDGSLWRWGRLDKTVSRQTLGTVGMKWGLDSSQGLKGSSEGGWHGKWTCGVCDTAEAEQSVLQWQNKWRHLAYLPSLFCFTVPSLLLCFEDAFHWPTA